ncbi:hypothetical protein Tco_1035676 [Tanacetum coccineum]
MQAMIDADYQMAQQMQAKEQEKLSIEEKSKLLVELLEARKKHFAAMRAQEKRNKPPTKAQKRNTMSTYLKNMAGYNHNQLKTKSFHDIQKLFDKAMIRLALPSLAKPSFASFSNQAMLCHSITSLPLFKSYYYHTSPSPSSSSLSSSPSSSMSCSNPPSNFSRKLRMLVRQVWRRTTLTSKSPPSQNASPSLPLRVNPQSSSPPSHNLLRNQMINQLYNISSILESQAQNSHNAYSYAPPSPLSPLIHPPTNA